MHRQHSEAPHASSRQPASASLTAASAAVLWLALQKDGRAVSQAEVQGLYRESLWFSLASHFKWAMWAVVQAARSEIHFGYMEYAVQRMEEYYHWKETLQSRFPQDVADSEQRPAEQQQT